MPSETLISPAPSPLRDDAVDQLYKDLFVDFIGFVAKNPQSATEIAHLLYISKNLERVGDHATNCAQMIFSPRRVTICPMIDD